MRLICPLGQQTPGIDLLILDILIKISISQKLQQRKAIRVIAKFQKVDAGWAAEADKNWRN